MSKYYGAIFITKTILIVLVQILLVQAQPQIVSPPETVGVNAGQTAVLKCRVANLADHLVSWSFLTHDFVIFEGGQLLARDAKRYSLQTTAGNQVHNLQILNVVKSDQGFYKCAIEGTDQVMISHLDVVDAPDIPPPNFPPQNLTDCCLAENVTNLCLPGCFPGNIDLDSFNASAACGTSQNLRGLSKCFTSGSNHDHCCLSMKVNPVCLDICHNQIPSTISDVAYTTCFSATTINSIFTCFAVGYEILPSEPTEVIAMAVHDGLSASIQVKWAQPKKNAQYVTGYRILYKSRNQSSFRSILVDNKEAQSYRLTGDIEADMDYKVRLVALAEHGVSFGSAEVDIFVPNSSLSEKLEGDIDSCCSNHSVDEKCRNLLCHSKIWSQFHTDHVLACFPYLNDVFSCLVAQRNHTSCCSAFDLTSECLPLCSGHPPSLNPSLIGCVQQMNIIEGCVQQGYGILPAPPTQVTVEAVEATSATVLFRPSLSSGLSYYMLGVRKGNENASFVYGQVVPLSATSVQLTDLEPNTYYSVRLVSVGLAADSLPSESVSFLTYTEDYNDPTPEVVTNIPHNITECCMNTGMPAVCWKGCEYKRNITKYYEAELLHCYMHISSVLSCGADGRDHTECCRRRNVQEECIPLCAHTAKGALDRKYIVCIPDTPDAVDCFMEGIVNLPRHPDVVVSNVSKNSISLKWKQPATSGLVDSYTIRYGKKNTEKIQTSTNRTFYILQNLTPSTPYEVEVISSNVNGSSAPSPMITQYTLSDDMIIPTLNTTEVSGRALWENRTHCCNTSVQPECLEYCLNQQTPSVQDFTCLSESSKILACSADGNDHRLCCERRLVPQLCLPICAGHPLATDISLATCLSSAYRNSILSCFLDNKGLLPDAPGNFLVKLVGPEGTVHLEWSKPRNCDTQCTYTIHYWKVGEDSSILTLENLSVNSTQLQMQVDNRFTFTVTAENNYGSGAPSPWQTLFITSFEQNVYILIEGEDKFGKQGQSVKLICAHSGFNPDKPLSLQWLFNRSRHLVNDNKKELVLPNLEAKDEGWYTCTVNDSVISSSDSIFLRIKYPPRFVSLETLEADFNGRAKLVCFFRGSPDSDPFAWYKNGQLLPRDMESKYRVSSVIDHETGLTSYLLEIREVGEADYGTYSLTASNMFGKAECHINLTSSTRNTSKPPKAVDLLKCCGGKGMTQLCLELCGFHVNMTEVVNDSKYLPCLQYFEDYIACGADGRDHSKCCREKGVLTSCVPLCSGIVPGELLNAPAKLLQCVPQHTTIFSCAQQGHLLIPYAPEEISLTYKQEDSSILVQWKESHLLEDSVEYFNIYYNHTGRTATQNISVHALINEYYIRNVQPGVIYSIWLTAGNKHGNSLPTVVKSISTMSTGSPSPQASEQTDSSVAVGVGVTLGVVAFLIVLFIIVFVVYRSRLLSRTNKSVAFENPSFSDQGQVKIQGADEQYGYGRLHEEVGPDVMNLYDSSSTGDSAADSSFENPTVATRHKGQTSNPFATLALK